MKQYKHHHKTTPPSTFCGERAQKSRNSDVFLSLRKVTGERVEHKLLVQTRFACGRLRAEPSAFEGPHIDVAEPSVHADHRGVQAMSLDAARPHRSAVAHEGATLE